MFVIAERLNLPRPKREGGWGGWIRTTGCRLQRPMPYHLATPQRSAGKPENAEPGERFPQLTTVGACCGGACDAAAESTGSVTTNVEPLPMPSLCAVISP
jgi:hypothetical protein